MRSEKVVDAIETHTEGQVCRTVTGGVDLSDLEGDTVDKKTKSFKSQFDWLKEFLIQEPRGHENLVGAVPVGSDRADVGLIFFDTTAYLESCGDGVIGAVTALIETGQLEPADEVAVETPAGVVKTELTIKDGQVASVAIRDMQSFTYGREVISVTDGESTLDVPVEIAYGGNWFAFADITDFDMEVDIETIDSDRVSDLGVRIRDAVNEQIDVTDPLTGDRTQVPIVLLFQEIEDDPDRNVVVYAAGAIDRSPCGTGTAARMASLYDQGVLEVGSEFPHESLFGTRFNGRINDIEEDDVTTLSCSVEGSAHIVAKNTYLRDPADNVEPFVLE
jgi:proline racemase